MLQQNNYNPTYLSGEAIIIIKRKFLRSHGKQIME